MFEITTPMNVGELYSKFDFDGQPSEVVNVIARAAARLGLANRQPYTDKICADLIGTIIETNPYNDPDATKARELLASEQFRPNYPTSA